MATTAHVPTDKTRKLVELHAAAGTPQEMVAQLISVDAKTLRKHYREELDSGLAKANAAVAGSLFSAATRGNVTAMIFWLKTRAGWREKIHVDLANLSNEQIAALLAAEATERSG